MEYYFKRVFVSRGRCEFRGDYSMVICSSIMFDDIENYTHFEYFKAVLFLIKSIYIEYQSSRKRRIRRIFTPTFGFVRILFLLGILIYANFFFC